MDDDEDESDALDALDSPSKVTEDDVPLTKTTHSSLPQTQSS
jgi:hypothetical protein